MKPGFLNPINKKILPGTSLITAVKNRKESLTEALETWVSHKEIDEIIILDWSSGESLIPLVEKLQNGKIFLAVVPSQEKWILSFAYNLAARLTSHEKILKVDADVKVMPGFFDQHVLKPGEFFSGNWMLGRDDNEKHLNGSVFLSRADFFSVNGYNEYIKFYGWDDSDLYLRLESKNLTRHDFNLDALQHIPHESRTAFQNTAGYFRNMTDLEKSNLNTLTNRYLCSNLVKWTTKNKMLAFDIDPKNRHIWICMQSSEDLNKVPKEYYVESETNAIKERLQQFELGIPEEVASLLKRDEIIEYYNLFLSRSVDKPSGDLFNIISKFSYLYSANITNKINEINLLNENIISGQQSLADLRIGFHQKNVEVEKLNSDLHRLNVEIQRLAHGLHEKSVENQQLNHDIHLCNEEIQRLTGAFHEKRVEIQLLNSDFEKSKVEIEKLNGELHKSLSELECLNNDHHISKVRIEQLNSEAHTNNVEILQLRNDVERYNDNIQHLNGELHQGQVEVLQLRALLEQGRVEIERMNGELHFARVENLQLNEALHESKVEIIKLNEAFHKSNVEILRLNDALHKSNVEIQQKNKNLHESNVEIVQLKDELHQCHVEIEVQKDEFNKKNAALQESNTAIQSKDLEIARLLHGHRLDLSIIKQKEEELSGQILLVRENNETITTLNQFVVAKEELILDKDRELREKNIEIHEIKTNLLDQVQKNKESSVKIGQYETLTEHLRARERGLESRIVAFEQFLMDKEVALKTTQEQLDNIYKSRPYKVGNYIMATLARFRFWTKKS
ncbi:MAG: galactosyltransferase-related protein [Bacteroidales bacterium]